ncbi:MAG TPA: ImmA/IrrE family metallo-endopeptidase [Candidatus Paceibacterota bacterium]|nr:ImmA/IrrE family metallo-endopeptidase [Candidatus Paceibacterota bacterium]
MDDIKVIRTKEDYEKALIMIERLIDMDPQPESEDGEKLALLTALVKDYESRLYPETLPDPVEAIRYRMGQAGLKPADLIPYIGTRARVSEILSGKRQLTLDMVRALEAGLGIPAKVLIQKPSVGSESQYQHWSNELVRTMERRGYFGDKSLKKHDKGELVKGFFAMSPNVQPAALFRKTNYRTAPRTDRNALSAWMLRVQNKAQKIKLKDYYKAGTVTLPVMQDIVRLSVKEDGPRLAQEYLKKIGIKLVIEPHLPKTHLDGATLLMDKNNPVIGLTLRHDRPDNFWFTLMHELAHVSLHYDKDVEIFFDEKLQEKDGVDVKEVDADALAEDAILPESKWETSAAKTTPNQFSAEDLANELGIHIAVVAGVIRFKHHNFSYLTKIVNDKNLSVKKHFADEFKE